MQISQIIGGYTLGGADMLRRAMGKKKAEEMAEHRATIAAGAKVKGYDPALAEQLVTALVRADRCREAAAILEGRIEAMADQGAPNPALAEVKLDLADHDEARAVDKLGHVLTFCANTQVKTLYVSFPPVQPGGGLAAPAPVPPRKAGVPGVRRQARACDRRAAGSPAHPWAWPRGSCARASRRVRRRRWSGLTREKSSLCCERPQVAGGLWEGISRGAARQ